jgi:protein-disulfide isomerase
MTTRITEINLRSALDVVTSLVLIGAAFILVYYNLPTLQGTSGIDLEVPSEPVSIDGASLRGSERADTILMVFSDFQCPFCVRFARDVLPEIERDYVRTGKVALVFRHMPLAIHSQAVQAALSAECAGQQGRFWEMHDHLFAQEVIVEDTLRKASASLHLDSQRFEKCLSDPAVNKAVRAATEEASRLGVRGTPSFFFGRRLEDGRVRVSRAVGGVIPTSAFKSQLDAAVGTVATGWRAWVPFAN